MRHPVEVTVVDCHQTKGGFKNTANCCVCADSLTLVQVVLVQTVPLIDVRLM